jgi:folate-binding protein YgfZ
MNEMALHQIHQSLGGIFAPTDGRDTVRSYGNPLAEQQAVRKQAGLIDQSHRGKLRLTGKDRVEFLHGMVTNDVKKLAAGSGLYAVFTTDKAKMLSDARIYCLPDAFWLDLEAGTVGKIHKHLDKYTLASDVTVEQVTDSFGLLSIYGPASPGILFQFLSPGPLPGEEYSTARLFDEDVSILVARNEITGETGFDLYVPMDKAPDVWNRLLKVGSPHGLRAVGMDALNTLRIEAGIPRYGVDMDESNFPMETGLEKTAISYTKGCYIGQETIARADAQGRMSKHLSGLVLAGEPVPDKGRMIQAPSQAAGAERKSVGTVTSAVKSPTLGKVIALGYIHRDFTEPGSMVQIDGISVEVVRLPFYKKNTPSGA